MFELILDLLLLLLLSICCRYYHHLDIRLVEFVPFGPSLSVLARLEAGFQSLTSLVSALRFLELVLGYFQTVLVVEH